MKIVVNPKYGYVELVIEAENVHIEETISSTIYGKKEDGKIDYSKRLRIDIEDEYMEMFSSALESILDDRTSIFDSTSLIEKLFEKLGDNDQKTLIDKLNREYAD